MMMIVIFNDVHHYKCQAAIWVLRRVLFESVTFKQKRQGELTVPEIERDMSVHLFQIILCVLVFSGVALIWLMLNALEKGLSARFARFVALVPIFGPWAFLALVMLFETSSRDRGDAIGVGFLVFFAGIPIASLFAGTGVAWLVRSFSMK